MFSILVFLTKKRYSSILIKIFVFQKIDFKVKSIENVQNFHWLSHKSKLISQTEGYFENPWYIFLEEPMLFLLLLKRNL